MSQIETLMLLALGCSATLLFVLLFGRGIWSLLGRWSGWRDARQLPKTVLDLQAERDSLKAEKAMMSSKLDTSLADMKQRMAEQMAEVSRNRNRLLDANGRLQKQSEEIASLNAEITRRDEKIAALNGQIEENIKAIAKAWEATAEQESETARARRMHKEAVAAVGIREERIRSLEAEARSLRETVRASLPSNDIEAAPVRPDDLSLDEAFGNPLLAAAPAEQNPLAPNEPVNVFQARFNMNSPVPSVPPVSTAAGPGTLLADRGNNGPVSFQNTGQDQERGNLDQEMSNVLSLAERLRDLQKGMKRQR